MRHAKLFIMLLSIILSTTFAFALKSKASGDELRTVITELEKKYSAITTMTADFTQEAYSSSLKSSEHAEGTVSLKKPGMMRWDYSDEKQIISNGKFIWVFDPELAQVVETRVDPAKANITTDFLTEVSNLEKDFSVTLIRSDNKGYELSLTPKQPMGNTKELRVELNKEFILKKTTAIDSFNNETRIEFLDIKTDIEIPNDKFEYKEQKGIKVVRP